MASEITQKSAREAATLMGLSISQLVTLVTIAGVLVLLLVVLLLSRRPRRRPFERAYNADAYRRKIALDEAGYEMVNGVVIRGRDGKPLRLDHVIRLPASVLVVFSGPADATGRVSASPRSGLWRYVGTGGKIATYTNPVVQAKPLIQALRQRFPLVRIRVLTVFPETAEFIGGKPPTVCLSRDFMPTVRALARSDGDPSESLDAAWEPLSNALTHRKQDGADA